MDKILTVIGLSLLLVFLFACSPSEEVGVVQEGRVGLTAGDELSKTAVLAIGIIQLEETEQGVTAEQAVELLPLWQAVQSLSQSDTTAAAEITAVVNQIEGLMQPEQVAAIEAMEINGESVAALQESGLQGGFGGRGAANADGAAGEGAAGGGQGGPPGGGLGGGQRGGGGFAGGEVDEDAIATRRAQFADGRGGLQDGFLTAAVVRLLEQKTGVVNVNREITTIVLTAVSEATGLTVEEVRTQIGEAESLVALIEANGGDASAVETAVVEAIGTLETDEPLDAEQITADWLGR